MRLLRSRVFWDSFYDGVLIGTVVGVVIAVLVLLAGCQTLPPEVRTVTVTNTVRVPVATPCFAASDRPKLPEPTPLADEATPDQRAAALKADLLALQAYADQVDALFLLCQSVGVKP